MDKYLITALTAKRAVLIAKEMKLKRTGWDYIPCIALLRHGSIQGRRVSNTKYLIGEFTNEEREYLLPKQGSVTTC